MDNEAPGSKLPAPRTASVRPPPPNGFFGLEPDTSRAAGAKTKNTASPCHRSARLTPLVAQKRFQAFSVVRVLEHRHVHPCLMVPRWIHDHYSPTNFRTSNFLFEAEDTALKNLNSLFPARLDLLQPDLMGDVVELLVGDVFELL